MPNVYQGIIDTGQINGNRAHMGSFFGAPRFRQKRNIQNNVHGIVQAQGNEDKWHSSLNSRFMNCSWSFQQGDRWQIYFRNWCGYVVGMGPNCVQLGPE